MEKPDINIYEKKRKLTKKYADRKEAPIGIFDSGVGGFNSC